MCVCVKGKPEIVGIIRHEFYFCGFYECVNADEPLTNPADFIHFVSASNAFKQL